MYTPAIPLGGVAGWRFLQATESAQRAAFEASPQISREVAYFRDNIAEANTAEALVADRTLRTVALGAFGLEGDIDKQAYIRRVLEEGTTTNDAFANRLVNTSYRQLSAAFGYGDPGGATVGVSALMEGLAERHVAQAFEVAVGEVDNDMRLALNFERKIDELVGTGVGEETFWFAVLGDVPLRKVLEGALSLPSEFATLDIDRQAAEIADRARDRLGVEMVADFADSEIRQQAIQRYLVGREVVNSPLPGTAGYAALQLLGASAPPSSAGSLLSLTL